MYKRAILKCSFHDISEAFKKANDLLMYFTFRSNALTSCLGTEISPAGEISGVFCPRTKRGCLHTLESSAKYTIVLPQAKCRETNHYFHNPPTSSLRGVGDFLERKSPTFFVFPHLSFVSPLPALRQVLLPRQHRPRRRLSSHCPPEVRQKPQGSVVSPSRGSAPSQIPP